MRSSAADKVYSGRFSDGRTAASRTAAITLAETALLVRPGDGGPERIWPYSALTVQKPLRRRAPDILLQMRDEPGATLFIADRSFASELLKRAPQLGAGSYLWRFARPAVAIVGLIGLVIGGAWAADISPARTLAGLMPQKVRKAAGRHLFESLMQRYRVCDAAPGHQAVNAYLARLTAGLDKTRIFDVRVVDWGLVNAFALPGNTVVLTRGLIANANGPDEVAGVLAHEIGHGLRRHPETSLVRALGLALATKLIFVGASDTLSSAGALLVQLRFTRNAEREADDEALMLLRSAAISARPLGAFFARIRKKTDHAKNRPDRLLRTLSFLSTHPPLPEREAKIAEAGDYAAHPSLTPAQWQDLRNICGPKAPPINE